MKSAEKNFKNQRRLFNRDVHSKTSESAGGAPALQRFHSARRQSRVVGQAPRFAGGRWEFVPTKRSEGSCRCLLEGILTMSSGRREARAATGGFWLCLRLRCHLR